MATPPYVDVRFEDRGAAGTVARVSLAFAGSLNIAGTAQIAEMNRALLTLRGDDRLRVVVLQSATDKAFIGGADIHEMAQLDPHAAKVFISRLHEVCHGIRTLPVPVIAAISGYCLGGGLEVAVSCDMRVAAEGSVFGMPEVRVGIPSVIEAALLPQLIGWGKTRELLYTGRLLDHDEAMRIGLVERVVPAEELGVAVEEWVNGIVEAGPKAIELQKALIREWETASPDRGAELGIHTFEKAYLSDEPRRYMEAWINRRKPGENGRGSGDAAG